MLGNTGTYISDIRVTFEHHLTGDHPPSFTVENVPDVVYPMKDRLPFVWVLNSDATTLQVVWNSNVEMKDNWMQDAVGAEVSHRIVSRRPTRLSPWSLSLLRAARVKPTTSSHGASTTLRSASTPSRSRAWIRSRPLLACTRSCTGTIPRRLASARQGLVRDPDHDSYSGQHPLRARGL